MALSIQYIIKNPITQNNHGTQLHRVYSPNSNNTTILVGYLHKSLRIQCELIFAKVSLGNISVCVYYSDVGYKRTNSCSPLLILAFYQLSV